MKKYRVYLSDITWNRVNNLFPKEDRGWIKSDIVFMETMPYKELSNVRNEIIWHLVSNDYVEENKKLHSIIKEVREYIEKSTQWYDKELGLVEMEGYDSNRIPVVYLYGLLEIIDKADINV